MASRRSGNYSPIEQVNGRVKKISSILEKCQKKGIDFALSNVTIHDGRQNDLLLDWIEANDFTALDINSDYSNSNYHKKNREKEKNTEVLVINYPID